MPAGRTLVVVTIAILCSIPPALAQSAAVGRVSHSEGAVSIQARGKGEWTKAEPGNTLGVADNLWADQNSRAELRLGTDIVRVDSETSLTIESASRDRLLLKLWLGSVIVANDGNRSRMIRIETPNLTFALDEPGEYRLDVNAPGDETVATVWEGAGEVTGGGARYFIHAAQRATLSGTDDLQMVLGSVLPADDFDEWAMNRDQSLHSGESRPAAANDNTRPTDTDQSGTTPEEADERELGPDGPGTVEIRCPTPWCEVVEAYPPAWIWPPWWGPYPDPWVLTGSLSPPTPRTGGIMGTAGRRFLASETSRPSVVRSRFPAPPSSPKPVPAKAGTAEGGSPQPSNPGRNSGSNPRALGSAPSDHPSPTTASETKTTRH